MAADRTPESFTLVATDPAAWCQAGDRLWKAAQLLAKDLVGSFLNPLVGPRPDLRLTPSAHFVDGRIDLIWPTTLLLGLAAENFLKAAYVKKRWPVQPNPPLKRLPRDVTRGHRLSDLAAELRLPFSDNEREMLRRLETIVLWAGRYPVPIEATNPLNVAMLHSDDLRTFRSLRERLLGSLSNDS